MNKKVIIGSILAIFMLVSISFASSAEVSINKKDSPLYGIRTSREITDRLDVLLENIKTRFIGQRIFFLAINPSFRISNIYGKEDKPTAAYSTVGCWCP